MLGFMSFKSLSLKTCKNAWQEMAFLSKAPPPPRQAGSKSHQLGGKEQLENKRRKKNIIDADACLRNAPVPHLSEPNSC